MLPSTLACVPVSDVCLFCVVGGAKVGKLLPRVVCCGIWSLAVTSLHPPVSLLVCCLTEPPESRSTQRSLPTASSPQLLRKHTSKQSYSFNHSVEWRGGGACQNVGRGSASFYPHGILRIHFCYRRILQCMLRLGFNLYIRV